MEIGSYIRLLLDIKFLEIQTFHILILKKIKLNTSLTAVDRNT